VEELARVVRERSAQRFEDRSRGGAADLRRRLKRRGAAAAEVAVALERAISAADPHLAASALLAARRAMTTMLASRWLLRDVFGRCSWFSYVLLPKTPKPLIKKFTDILNLNKMTTSTTPKQL
jgi:hypothetical protein